MGFSVSEEMSDERRRDELIMGLSGTNSDKVFVNISHLIQAVGLKEAEKCVESLVQMEEQENPRAFTSRSAMRVHTRRSGICQVNREAALRACHDAKGTQTKKKIDTALSKQS